MNGDVYGKNIVLDHNWLAQFSTDFSKNSLIFQDDGGISPPVVNICCQKKIKIKKN